MKQKMRDRAVLMGLVLVVALAFSNALRAEEASSRDSLVDLRSEEIEAKQKRLDEVSSQVEVMHKQLELERRDARSHQEKIWKEFSNSLEVERREMKEKLETVDQKQRLFEIELEKKKQQDELRLSERDAEIRRLMLQMDRLRTEIDIDRKELAQYKERAKSQKADSGTSVLPGSETGSEVLENQAIRITGASGRELMGQSPMQPRQIRAEYYVEIGDIFEINVWRVPDLSAAVTVRPDGRISMPLVGDLDVLGLTLTQVRDEMTKRLAEYVRDPQVSISIRQFGGRKFVILGQIKTPGVYRFQQEMSLLEALALAGGFADNAKRGKIMIIRGDIKKNPQVKVISANVDNVLKKGMLTENLTILSNDILYVGKDFLGDFNEVIDEMVKPVFSTTTDFFVVRSAARVSSQKRN